MNARELCEYIANENGHIFAKADEAMGTEKGCDKKEPANAVF